MYKIEYFRQSETGTSSLARTAMGGEVYPPVESEEVGNSTLYFGNPGFVVFNSTNAPYEVLKVVPCHRVKSITKV